jgi:hypothetical protein
MTRPLINVSSYGIKLAKLSLTLVHLRGLGDEFILGTLGTLLLLITDVP